MVPRKPRDPSLPYVPAPYSKYDVYAMKALQEGKATPEQQQRALAWIINICCRTYDLPYHPGGEEGNRDSILAMGKMHAGQQIVKLINYPASLLHNIKE